jgi:hypothetical protein
MSFTLAMTSGVCVLLPHIPVGLFVKTHPLAGCLFSETTFAG